MSENYLERVLTKGPFAGMKVVAETSGTTVTVVCPVCGWQAWQTFFIRDFTEKDIGRECDECGNKNLIFGPEEDND
jgi:ribosomal protein S27E